MPDPTKYRIVGTLTSAGYRDHSYWCYMTEAPAMRDKVQAGGEWDWPRQLNIFEQLRSVANPTY